MGTASRSPQLQAVTSTVDKTEGMRQQQENKMRQHSFAEYCVHAYLPEAGSNYQLPCCSAAASRSVK